MVRKKGIRFTCKALGTITFTNYYTYLEYKRLYKDLIPYGNGILIFNLEEDWEITLKAINI